jgi:hypothetical protein
MSGSSRRGQEMMEFGDNTNEQMIEGKQRNKYLLT